MFFYFVLSSLIRTFDPWSRYFRSEIQRKTRFSLVFRSLIRTFAGKELKT